jgi:hypothetical protein
VSRFRRRRWLIAAVIALILIGLVVAGASARRMFRRPRGPLPPRQTDVTLIASWMTVPYVSRTFGVPPDELYRVVGIPREGNDRKSLNDLAADTGRSSGELPAPPAKPGGPFGGRGPPAKATP